MTHFNQLSAAEAERLAMLAEEASEIIQIVGKILRHGYSSKHPADLSGPDNREMLHREIGDMNAVINLMEEKGDVTFRILRKYTNNKQDNLLKFTHHQR